MLQGGQEAAVDVHCSGEHNAAMCCGSDDVGADKDPQFHCRVGKDPRFEDLSGAYNADRFRKQYAFLYDEQLPAEKSDLKAAMKVHMQT